VLLLTWWLFAMYYACRFNYSPMIPLIKSDLNILNTQAGWLMACFFISYTAFQIPSGYMGDRFGPRKTLSWGAAVSIAGNLIFSQGSSFMLLAAAQVANGMGQALGWNSAVKMIVNWFPRSRRATAIGLFITCVTVGSSFGIRLAGFLGNRFGWRSAFIIPPALLGLTTLLFWTLVRDNPEEKGLPGFNDENDIEQRLQNDPRPKLVLVLSNRTLWFVGLVYFCFVYVQFGCLVWIPSFVTEAWSMNIDRASLVVSLILLPGVFAAPLGGYLSDHYFKGRRKPLIIFGMSVLALSCWAIAAGIGIHIGVIVLSVVGLMIIMPDILLAAFPADIFSRKLTATALGFLATFTSASGIVSMVVTGKLADLTGSFNPTFICFGFVALIGAVIAGFIHEKTGSN
jgi:sugar phosphate permease